MWSAGRRKRYSVWGKLCDIREKAAAITILSYSYILSYGDSRGDERKNHKQKLKEIGTFIRRTPLLADEDMSAAPALPDSPIGGAVDAEVSTDRFLCELLRLEGME